MGHSHMCLSFVPFSCFYLWKENCINSMLTLQAFAVHPPPPTFSIQYFFLHFLFSLQFALLVVYHTRNLQKLYH